MKYTLLEVVQEILSDLSGDEVDSISDTAESTQVASIVKSTYNHIVSQKDLIEHKVYFQLEETTSATPTLMRIPEDILKVYWIDYDQKHNPGAFSGGVFSGDAFDTTESAFFSGNVYKIEPDEFFRRAGRLSWTGTDIDAFTYTSDSGDLFEVKYETNTAPTYYTSIGQRDIIFNALNLDVNASNLEATNSWGYGLKEPVFTLSDSFVPDLDALEFNWLVEESKSAASLKLRQMQDPVATQRARRGLIRSQKNVDNKVPGPSYSTVFPNYGRRR